MLAFHYKSVEREMQISISIYLRFFSFGIDCQKKGEEMINHIFQTNAAHAFYTINDASSTQRFLQNC